MIKVVHQGLGPVGLATAKLVNEDPELKIVGASDIQQKEPLYGMPVNTNPKQILEETKPDVLVLTTNSTLDGVVESILDAVRLGIHVVTPAEEMFYPEYINSGLAKKLNSEASRCKVNIAGYGVNPGVLMDTFPVRVFGESNVDSLEYMAITRHDDSTHRRRPLLEKTGAGMTPKEFEEKVKGHVGLEMSAAYVADCIGLEDYELKFKRAPVIASEDLYPTQGEMIPAGKVAGLYETCIVMVHGDPIVSLNLQMSVGATNENSVMIKGIKDSARVRYKKCYYDLVNGDLATARVLHNMIYSVAESETYGLNAVPAPSPEILIA